MKFKEEKLWQWSIIDAIPYPFIILLIIVPQLPPWDIAARPLVSSYAQERFGCTRKSEVGDSGHIQSISLGEGVQRRASNLRDGEK